MKEINQLNKNFESIYNKKFSDSNIPNRPNTGLNNRNFNPETNEMKNYETGKDSLFGAKQPQITNNTINSNTNRTDRNINANKSYPRSNSVENNKQINKNAKNTIGNTNKNLPKMDVLNDE